MFLFTRMVPISRVSLTLFYEERVPSSSTGRGGGLIVIRSHFNCISQQIELEIANWTYILITSLTYIELLSEQTNQKGHISSYDNNSKEDDILIEDSIQAFTQRSESRL